MFSLFSLDTFTTLEEFLPHFSSTGGHYEFVHSRVIRAVSALTRGGSGWLAHPLLAYLLPPTGGYGVNLLWAEWISFSVSVTLFGALILGGSSLVPPPVRRLFIYGKAAAGTVAAVKDRLARIELPKRWFYHFYLFATTFYTLLAWSVVQVYVVRQGVPRPVAFLLDTVVGSFRRATLRPESVMIAVTLIWFQVVRRLAECTLLSVYSDAKMNLVHYVFGFSFYFGVGLSIIAEAPGYTGFGIIYAGPSYAAASGATVPVLTGSTISGTGAIYKDIIQFTGSFLTLSHIIGISLFCVFSYVQFKTHAQLAALRKDSHGRVVTLGHSIPTGDWFEYISCPHYFAEIMIYLSLNCVLGGRSATWWMVCTFVVSNQIIVGLFNHRWYQETFGKAYPPRRRAVIPFLI